MKLDVHRLCHRVTVTQVLHESEVWRCVQRLPLAILVLLPRHVIEGWRHVLSLGDHCEHQTPRLVLWISHQVVLEHAGFTDHNLENAGHIADDCDCTCCTVWDTLWQVEKGGVERLVRRQKTNCGGISPDMMARMRSACALAAASASAGAVWR